MNTKPQNEFYLIQAASSSEVEEVQQHLHHTNGSL